MKKFLLTLIIAIASILTLALVASADVIYKDADGNELFRYELVDGIITNEQGVGFAKEDADKNALTWYTTANETVGSDTVYTVASVKTSEATTVSNGTLSLNTKLVTKATIVSINFDVGNYTTIAGKIFYDSTSVLYAYIPSYVTVLGERTFRGASKLIKLDIPYDSQLTDMGTLPVWGTTNLRELFIPQYVSEIKNDSTSTNGQSNNSGGHSYLNNCKALKKVTFHPDNVIEELKNAPFINSTYVEEIRFGNNLKFLGDRSFRNCGKLKTVYFGDSFEGFYSVYMFWSCASLESLYIPSTVTTNTTSLTHNWSQIFDSSCSSKFKIYFTGTEEQFINFYDTLVKAGNNPQITNMVADGVINSDRVVFTTDCEAFYYNEHSVGADAKPTCALDVACTRCGSIVTEALGHDYTSESAILTDIVYSSFDKDGYKCIKCSRCTEVDTSVTANAILTPLGYSSKNSGTGISGGFKIDLEALNAYEALKNTTVHFGIFVANPKYLTQDTFFSNGTIAAEKGAIQVEMSSRSYATLNFIITGFDASSSSLTSMELVIGAFAYEGDNTSSVQLIQKDYSTMPKGSTTPMLSKVVKGNDTLYTVGISSVTNQDGTILNKKELDDYIAKN